MAFSLRKKMNKKKFLAYFRKKSKRKDEPLVTENVTSAELAYAEEEMQKTYERPKKYQAETPAKIKKEVGLYARDFGTASAIKKFTIKYPKYSFIRVNTWKKKYNDGDWTVIKRIGKPNLLDSGMVKKVKHIALGTRMAGGVINRPQLISIATEKVTANNPNLLKEYGGDLVLTDKWARRVLEKLTWSKRKDITVNVDPSLQFLAEEKFTFKKNISTLVS